MLASFDITSLFTNVPIKETIKIVIDSLYSTTNGVCKLEKKDFEKLLKLCINDNSFVFNNEHYKQHEGFSMGSPLSAPMANIFLCFHEEKWLSDCPADFKPILYKRYVDDTFLVFKDKSHVPKFLQYMNNKHQNINFTLENELDNKLNFLDINIKKNFNADGFTLDFSIFRKQTFTGLGMNFHSHTSLRYKLNNIRTLLHRAYSLCNDWFSLHKELCFLLNFFKNNAYPTGTVYNIIKKFLNNKHEHREEVIQQGAKKLIIYQKLPYINELCCSFLRTETRKIINRYFPQLDFRLVFFNSFTTKSLLNHKERLPDDLCSGVCYLFTCCTCSATYVGSSVRCLRTRAGEHFGRSTRTGSLLAKPTQSRIRDHIFTCGSGFNFNDFKILSSYNDTSLLRIAESIEILYRKPILNTDESSFPLSLT